MNDSKACSELSYSELICSEWQMSIKYKIRMNFGERRVISRVPYSFFLIMNIIMVEAINTLENLLVMLKEGF